ncbi:MAG: transglycosylase domain-containing protein [Chloroflexota bacterium]|nr:transglycosylase domain-containing protein [Chloroflexota bacterium]
MDRVSTIPVLSLRQRRRKQAQSPIWRIWLALLALLLMLTFFLFAVPTTMAAVGGLYLAERTPEWVDHIVEGIVVQGVAFYAENVYEGELPSPDAVAEGTAREFKTTKIYDRTGTHLLWEVYDPRGGNRQVVPLDAISPHLINATIALEDKTFYDNPGVDLRGIARAAYLNLRAGTIQGGGSSITQQLIKLVAIDAEERYEQSYERKIKEAILAVELSRLYDKDTVLEWYLNTINYGNLAYGAEAAANTYFGKNAGDLTVAEAALLAIIPNQPASYDPFTQPEAAIERQQVALRRMWEEGYLTYDSYEAALAEPVLEHLVRPIYGEAFKAPHFTLYALRELEELLQTKYQNTDLLYNGGLTIYSTLDYEQFLKQQQIARDHIAALQAEGIDASNAAIVTINPRTGEILTLMGSLDYNNEAIDGEINMAVVPRQPGSSVKPYTYLTAFANGFTPASLVWDVRTVFDDYPNPPYVPENYYRDYNGPVLFRDALALSLNIPAVKVMDMVGIDRVIETMHVMGINTLRKEDVGLSLTLGGGEVTLLDHAYAFGVMANNGVMVGQPAPPLQQRPGYRELNPVSILRVVDAKGDIIHAYTQPETRQVISPQLAYLMQDIMSDNEARIPAFGEDNRLVLPDRPVAAKTGTTNDFRDGWTLGFTPQYVTGVWVGNADYRVMTEEGEAPGSKVAAPIWQQGMMHLHEGLPVERFSAPSGIVQVQVCAKSGMLPSPHCPEVKTEIFVEGTQPTAHDTLFQPARLCGDSGRLATVYCPPELIRTEVFMMIPPEAEDWARANNIPLPPTVYDSSHVPTAGEGPIVILNPLPYTYVSGTVAIEGNAYLPVRFLEVPIVDSTEDEEDRELASPTPISTPTEGADDEEDTVELPQTRIIEVSDFRLYYIEVGQGLDPAAWTRVGPEHTEPRSNSALEFWDTRGFEDGLYTVQLTVVGQDDSVQRASTQVYVDNVAPEVRITYPYPDTVHELGGDSWLNIQAQASDNITMDQVEFYINDRLIGSSHSTFNVRWMRDDAGLADDEEREIELYAVAIDAAGNRTQSEPIRIRVVGR